MTSTLREGRELRLLHHEPEILVLVNVWDVASARTVAALPGCRAIATAQLVDRRRSRRPGRRGPHPRRDARRRRDASPRPSTCPSPPISSPATARLPRTSARPSPAPWTPGSSAPTSRTATARSTEAAARVAAAARPGGRRQRPVRRQRAARHADRDRRRGRGGGRRGPGPIWTPAPTASIPIRITDPVVIEDVRRADRRSPVNAFGRPDGPSVAELEALGVARVSFGPGPMGAAMAALRRIGTDPLAGGSGGRGSGVPPAGLSRRHLRRPLHPLSVLRGRFRPWRDG